MEDKKVAKKTTTKTVQKPAKASVAPVVKEIKADKPAPKTTAKAVSKKASVSVAVHSVKGTTKTTVDLPDAIFNHPVSPKLLAQYVRVYLANQRQGGASVKSRGEITASTRKIYKQKGTGRARHGALSAPIFVGGGVAHGPGNSVFTLHLNKKQKTKALFGALTDLVKRDCLCIIEGADTISKTQQWAEMMTKLPRPTAKTPSTIFIYSKEKNQPESVRSAANIQDIDLAEARILNAYDVMSHGRVIMTQEALNVFLAMRGL